MVDLSQFKYINTLDIQSRTAAQGVLIDFCINYSAVGMMTNTLQIYEKISCVKNRMSNKCSDLMYFSCFSL